MNYAGDDIVNFNGCMRKYSPVQMKTEENCSGNENEVLVSQNGVAEDSSHLGYYAVLTDK